jgi:hypothetical protein
LHCFIFQGSVGTANQIWLRNLQSYFWFLAFLSKWYSVMDIWPTLQVCIMLFLWCCKSCSHTFHFALTFYHVQLFVQIKCILETFKVLIGFWHLGQKIPVNIWLTPWICIMCNAYSVMKAWVILFVWHCLSFPGSGVSTNQIWFRNLQTSFGSWYFQQQKNSNGHLADTTSQCNSMFIVQWKF